MKKILYFFSLITGIGLLLSSCDDDLKGTLFVPSADQDLVSFLAEDFSPEMVAADNNQIRVEVFRVGNTAEALEVPVSVVPKDDNADYGDLFSVTNVSFAAGETKSYAIISYDDLDALNPSIKYGLVLEIEDKDLLSPGAIDVVNISAQRKLTYKPFGTGIFTSEFFGASWPVEVEKAEEADFYKIIDCYVEGYNIIFSVDNDMKIAFDYQPTGYEDGTYGMISIEAPYASQEAPDSYQLDSTFNLNINFTVSLGSFGVALETLTMN